MAVERVALASRCATLLQNVFVRCKVCTCRYLWRDTRRCLSRDKNTRKPHST